MAADGLGLHAAVRGFPAFDGQGDAGGECGRDRRRARHAPMASARSLCFAGCRQARSQRGQQIAADETSARAVTTTSVRSWTWSVGVHRGREGELSQREDHLRQVPCDQARHRSGGRGASHGSQAQRLADSHEPAGRLHDAERGEREEILHRWHAWEHLRLPADEKGRRYNHMAKADEILRSISSNLSNGLLEAINGNVQAPSAGPRATGPSTT